MNEKRKRSVIQATAISLLLAASWYFSRSHAVPWKKNAAESAAVVASRTKTADRTALDPAQARRRQDAISPAAQKWYEQLLETYPQMRPEFRDVPDDQNGFLQFLILAERIKKPKLPDDLNYMLGGGSAWDAAKFKAWLAENKDYAEEILRVAELPDRSIKGLDLGRFAYTHGMGSEFGKILSGAAHLAFENGDPEAALRYGKASISLSNHLTGIEAPSLLGEVIAVGIRENVRDSFLENIMPELSDNPAALASWREALFRTEAPASEYARVLIGDWNTLIRTNVLPALLGKFSTEDEKFQVPDEDAFFEKSAEATWKLATSLPKSGPDRLDVTHGELEFTESGIDPKTLETLREMAAAFKSLVPALGIHVTGAAMISAAISIQLGEQPPVDPVSGKPFRWDPATRTLFPPDGVENHDPIKLR